MRIAIYNKDKNCLIGLKKMIYSYAEKFKLDVLIECFNCCKDLLASQNKYHIVFLDYSAKNPNGIKVASRIADANQFCSIVFTSRENKFDNNIFTIPLSGIISYPIKESEVCFVLDNYFYKRKNGYPMLVKSGLDTVCLNVNEIVYLEANNKNCVLHLGKESINCNKTMAMIYETLPKKFFLKINRSNVINSEYVNRFNSDEVMLKTGERLFISRNYRKNFKENYCDFISGMGM